MRVEIWNDGARWDEFVEARPDACNYHRWTWRAAVQETYGHKPYYLAATKGENIIGILPLFSIQSLLFGRSLVSMPFFSYGGVLGDSDQAANGLLEQATNLAKSLRARRIEIRAATSGGVGWAHDSPKIAMSVDLSPSLDEVFNRLNPKLRKRIRYGKKNGLTAACKGSEALQEFFPIFAANMRNLGTPTYPRKWFDALCQAAPKDIRILMIYDESQPVAGAFLNGWRDTLEMPWAASLPDSRKKFSPLFLYWSVLEWAHQNGFRTVDLGRSTPGSGNYEFKRHWATDQAPLTWSHWVARGGQLPKLQRENPQYGLAIKLWKRLPLPVANVLGPMVVRAIP